MKKHILIGLIVLLGLSTQVMADDNMPSSDADISANAISTSNNNTTNTSGSNGATTNGGIIANPNDSSSNSNVSADPTYMSAPSNNNMNANSNTSATTTNNAQAITSDNATASTDTPVVASKLDNALHVSYIYGGFVGFGLYCSFAQDDLKLINDRYNYLITQMHLSSDELKEVQKAYILDTKFSKTKGPAAANMSCVDFKHQHDALIQYIKISNQNGMKPLFVATQLDPATGKPVDASSVQATIEASQKPESHTGLFIGLGVLVLFGIGYGVWKKYY
jgi:hypothetical protein